MHHSPRPPPPVSPNPRHREPTSSWLTWHFLHFSSSSPRLLAHRFLLQSSPARCSSAEWPAKESQVRSCGIRDPWEQGQDPAERPQPAGSTHIHLRGAGASAAPGVGTLFVPRDLGSKPHRCLPWVHTPHSVLPGDKAREVVSGLRAI